MDEILIHSGDLTAKCPHARLLQRAGKCEAKIPKAMYRGLVAGRAQELIVKRAAEGLAVSPLDAVEITAHATEDTFITLGQEGRILSDSIDPEEMSWEITEVMGYFIETALPELDIIPEDTHTEVPVRFTTKSGNVFESHLDVLVDLGDNHYHIIDFKWTKSLPWGYAVRSPQMAAYAHALWDGQIYLDPFWCDVSANLVQTTLLWTPGLMPYKRKTTITVEGEQVIKEKGDHRPKKTWFIPCVWTTEHLKSSRDWIHREIDQRADWILKNNAPAIPDAEGCMACSSRDWCSIGHLGLENIHG